MSPEEMQQMQILQQASNPNAGRSNIDMLNDQLAQARQRALETQMQGIEQTQAQINQLGDPREQRNLQGLAMLADMFRPQGAQGPSSTQFVNALNPNQGRERIQLQNILARQQQGLAGLQTAGIEDQLAQEQQQQKFDFQQQLLQQRQAGEMDRQRFATDEAIRLAQAKNAMAGQGGIASNLTPGQKDADKAFGKDYQKWVSGGFSNVQGNLEKLQGALDTVNDPNSEMGKVLLPEAIRARTAPETVAVEQEIGNVVFQSLKEILGGQFAEKEGQKLVQQSYDPRLSDEENAAKIRSSLEKLRRMAEAKQAAVAYFADNGTLKGFPGAKSETLEGFTKQLKSDFLGDEAQKTDRAAELRKKYGL